VAALPPFVAAEASVTRKSRHRPTNSVLRTPPPPRGQVRGQFTGAARVARLQHRTPRRTSHRTNDYKNIKQTVTSVGLPGNWCLVPAATEAMTPAGRDRRSDKQDEGSVPRRRPCVQLKHLKPSTLMPRERDRYPFCGTPRLAAEPIPVRKSCGQPPPRVPLAISYSESRRRPSSQVPSSCRP
jgi:hypothetical protein